MPSWNSVPAKSKPWAGRIQLEKSGCLEEAINLWKLENSSKEEMLESAVPPLLCRQAAWGAISGTDPVLGTTSDAAGILCPGLGALLGSQWIFEGAGKMEKRCYFHRGVVFLWDLGGMSVGFYYSFKQRRTKAQVGEGSRMRA